MQVSKCPAVRTINPTFTTAATWQAGTDTFINLQVPQRLWTENQLGACLKQLRRDNNLDA
jgi:hypothetical protein